VTSDIQTIFSTDVDHYGVGQGILFWGSDLELSDIQSLNVKDVWRQFVKDVPALYSFQPCGKAAEEIGFSH
jgi:hypothetical protein